METPTIQEDDKELRRALDLIKLHIGETKCKQWHRRNKQLHAAVQIIVTVARRHGLLLEHGGR